MKIHGVGLRIAVAAAVMYCLALHRLEKDERQERDGVPWSKLLHTVYILIDTR